MTHATCKTRKRSFRKNKKTKKNTKKTCRLTRVCKKNQFVKEILTNWRKQTHGGCFEKDKTTQYINDYYLSLGKVCDYNNHIHVILDNYEVKANHNKNTILYLMKKYNNTTGVISHSPVVEISIYSEPAKVVKRMLNQFAKYKKS